jgi:hypothetical protein
VINFIFIYGFLESRTLLWIAAPTAQTVIPLLLFRIPAFSLWSRGSDSPGTPASAFFHNCMAW